jgi:hypothetical protein
MSGEIAGKVDGNKREKRTMNWMRRLRSKVLVATACCALAAAVAVPAAQADFGISDFNISTETEGQFSRQAGAHPDFTFNIGFAVQPPDGLNGDGEVKTIKASLPAGMLANPTAAPTCTTAELQAGFNGKGAVCPIGSQIGVVYIYEQSGSNAFPALFSPAPVYNMVPPNDSPALFSFNAEGVIVKIAPTVRGVDYGIDSVSPSVSQAIKVLRVKVVLWGVPADPSHNPDRALGDTQNFDHGHPSSAPPLPFMINPTSCPSTAQKFVAESDSWQAPGVFDTALTDVDPEGTPFVFSGCERLPFDANAAVLPGTHRAASPTGLDLTINVHQSRDPYGLATAHVRKVVTTFPRGMTVSPSAVAGLGACSLDQIGLGSTTVPTCPDSSKIGNVTVKTPLLSDPLEGEVVLARQNENPFHSLFAIYLVIKGPGFYIKLPGELNVDKQTGQMKTVFDNNPQLPFSELHLDFRGGPTAPLVTPNTCGTYTTHTEITSWASPDPVVVEAPMLIDENCSGGGTFNPTLQAGVASPVAGANSPLTIRIRRQDGEQNISRFDITLPEGELAKLKGVEVCPEGLAAIANCGKASQVGISTTAIGTGAFPLFVPQPGKDPTALYLAGPYKGAPYSLITKVPAQSGPFDFGLIVVRTAINVDPVTTQVIAKTDPLPQILEGVPIAYRDVRIEVQKPDFTVNPTSCEQRRATTTITSIEGATAHPSTPFKVGDCASLDFGPKLALRVAGGTNRGDYQALTATLTTHKHEANISRVAVALPHSEFLAQEHIRTICTRVQFAAKKCPDGSIYGFAKATTPLLDKPLEGPVYLRSSNNPLPDLVASLNGQFDIELAGRIDSVNGGIRNTFEVVPDAPVTKFVLKMKGGEKSLLVNSRNLCKSKAKAEVKMIGQNGKRFNSRPVLRNGCGKKSGKRAKRTRR